MSNIPNEDANPESLHHSCFNPMACSICCRGVQHAEPTIRTMADLLETLKPKHTIAVSSEGEAERIRTGLDEAGLRATVVVNSIVDEGQAIVISTDLGPVPGAPKKIDVFRNEVESGTGTTLDAEDAASRGRLERYAAMADGPAKAAAIAAEHDWREDLGLEEIA